MKILVLGAGGRLGRHIVAELLGRDHQVRAFLHRNDPLDPHSGLELFHGDVHEPTQVFSAMAGIERVMSALGSADAAIKDVSSSAMRNLVPAVIRSGVSRVVSSTGSAACTDEERTSPHPHLRARYEQMMRGNPALLRDAEEHMRLLAASNLDWTVVRAPPMGGEPAAVYSLSRTPPAPASVSSYRAVAMAMADLLPSQDWLKAAPFVW